jgi:hypothetical protein
MPAKSQSQFRFMQAVAHDPGVAKRVGMSSKQAKEYTESNVGKKAYKNLPEKLASGGKPGLYANIHAKQERIKHGSGEHMRKPGSPGAPTAKDFRDSEKTAKKKSGGEVSLTLGRKEINPTSKGAGLTAKGREKYNRATGSHLQAPQPEGGPRKDSFCARMSGVVKHSKGDAERAKASLKKWKCPGW